MTVEEQTHIEECIKTELGKRQSFWRLNLSQTITIVLVLLAGVSIWFGTQARLSNVEVTSKANTERIYMVDTTGTQFSRHTIAMEQQQISAHEQRLQKLEDVSVKLAVMQSVIDQIQKDVQELKAEVKHPCP